MAMTSPFSPPLKAPKQAKPGMLPQYPGGGIGLAAPNAPSPQAAPPSRPVSAANPQLAGLAAGVNQMHDMNVANAARPQQPTYIQQQLAATAPPQSPGIGLATAQPSSPPQQPLMNFPATQGQFNQGMQRENPMGALFGGALPVRGPNGRPTFASGPERDMSQKLQFGKDSGASQRFATINSDPNNPLAGQHVGYKTKETEAAKALFNARRGGPEKRQEAYQGRVASEAKERAGGVLAAATKRGEDRAEKVRLQKGRLTFDERLAMQDHQAAAQKAYGQGQLGLAKEQGAARISADAARTAAAERMAKDKNASNEKIAGLGLAKAGVDPVTGKPVDVRTDAEKIEGANSLNLADKTHEERKKMTADLPPETADRLIREAESNDRGFFGQPIAGTGAPGKAPVTRGEAIRYGWQQLNPMQPGPNSKNPDTEKTGPRKGWQRFFPPVPFLGG